MKEADVGGNGLAQATYEKVAEDSIASRDGTCFKVTNMFDRTDLGEDLDRW
jgi:hypothetical protein